MTYREVYKMVKTASLDKKALMGPLAFLKKHPQIVNAVWKMPVSGFQPVSEKLYPLSELLQRKTPTLAKVLMGGAKANDAGYALRKVLHSSLQTPNQIIPNKFKRIVQRLLTAANYDPHVHGIYAPLDQAKLLRYKRTRARQMQRDIFGATNSSPHFNPDNSDWDWTAKAFKRYL